MTTTKIMTTTKSKGKTTTTTKTMIITKSTSTETTITGTTTTKIIIIIIIIARLEPSKYIQQDSRLQRGQMFIELGDNSMVRVFILNSKEALLELTAFVPSKK